MEKERLQKVVAEMGQYSRRAVEKLIEERKVKVNGVLITQQGVKVDPTKDRIQIDGKPFVYKKQDQTIVVLLNKPRRVVVTKSDPQERKTVYDLLPKSMQNLKPVGRLDYNSQGALLLTNDGDLILKLTHPRYHFPKVYLVKVSSEPDEGQIKRMSQGVVIDGKRTMPAQIKIKEQNKSSTILEFKLEEGKNRQIRKMCEAVGLVVKELRRTQIGFIQIKTLRSGGYRQLTPAEVRKLKA